MYQLGSNIDIEHTHTPEEETHYGDHSPGDSEKTVRQYRKTGKYKKKTEKMTQDVKDIENTTAKATKKNNITPYKASRGDFRLFSGRSIHVCSGLYVQI